MGWLARLLGRRPPHALVVCAVVKDEGPYLAEWLAFHRAAGVGAFLIYDHDSRDDTRAVLDRFERAFPGAITVRALVSDDPQREAYTDGLKRVGALGRWAAFIDADEFLFGVEQTLPEVLADFEDVACLCAHWMIYGSSGHEAAPEGLCIEAYTRRARAEAKTNQHYKAIVRTDRIRGYYSPHRPAVRGRTVDENHRDIDPAEAGRSRNTSHARIRINHYIVKSKTDWARKQKRGSPSRDDAPDRWRPDSYFTDYDRNEREDPCAQRLAPQVKAILAKLEPG